MSDKNISSQRQALSLVGGRRVEVEGVTLWVVDTSGSGPCVLCLHAAGQGSRDFDAFIKRASPRLRVVALDWPGHGKSGSDARPPNAQRYAELAVGLCDTLDLHNVVLLGNSVGGAAATLVAARRPDRVAGLVLCNAGGFAKPGAFVRGFTRFMARLYRRGAQGAWWFPKTFAMIYGRLLRGPSAEEQRRRIIAAGHDHAVVLSQLWTSFGEPVNDVRDAASAVACPVWLAWAKSDPFNNYLMLKPGLARLRGKLSFFAGGHAPFLEQPDAFFEDFEKFVAQLDLAPPSSTLDVSA